MIVFCGIRARMAPANFAGRWPEEKYSTSEALTLLAAESLFKQSGASFSAVGSVASACMRARWVLEDNNQIGWRFLFSMPHFLDGLCQP